MASCSKIRERVILFISSVAFSKMLTLFIKGTQVILHQLTFTFDLLTRIVNTKWPQFASCCWAKGAHSLFRTYPMLQLRMSARQRLLSALNLPISNSCFIKCLIIKVTDD